MKEPNVEKVKGPPPPQEAALEDSSKGNPPITRGSLILIDKELQLEQGVTRPRGAEDSDEEPLVFKNIKRIKVGNVVEISKKEEDLGNEILESIQYKEWGMEGPLDLYVEVWESFGMKTLPKPSVSIIGLKKK